MILDWILDQVGEKNAIKDNIKSTDKIVILLFIDLLLFQIFLFQYKLHEEKNVFKIYLHVDH